MTTLALDTEQTMRATSTAPSEDRVRAHLHMVWRYLRMHGASAGEADDLTQESFVIAAQKGALGLDAAATAAFLRRTARFLFLRSRRGDPRAELLADSVDALWRRDCADGGEALLAALRECLRRLTPRVRRAIELAYGLGGDAPQGRAQLAAELGLQENGIKTLMQRARQQLRACIDRRKRDD